MPCSAFVSSAVSRRPSPRVALVPHAGAIPPELGQLGTLESLSLHCSGLTGRFQHRLVWLLRSSERSDWCGALTIVIALSHGIPMEGSACWWPSFFRRTASFGGLLPVTVGGTRPQYALDARSLEDVAPAVLPGDC